MSLYSLQITGTIIITLSSDLNLNGTFLIGGTTLTTTINGLFNINVVGNLTQAGTTSVVNGTATIVMTGSGTISTTSSNLFGLNITLDTAGTIIFSSVSTYIGIANGKIFLITAVGTLTTTGNTFYVNGTLTINVSSLIFNIVKSSNSAIMNGSSGFTMYSYNCTTVGLTINWKSTNTYTITTSLTLTGTAASNIVFLASTGSSKAKLIVNPGATIDVGFVNATDIDSSGGLAIYDYKGTLSNTDNWNLLTNPKTLATIFN